MKVVILGKWPSEDLIGGVANHTQSLVRSLSELPGIEVSVVSFAHHSKVFRKGNAKIVLIKSRMIYYLFPLFAILRLLQVIQKENVDLLHLQGSNLSPYLITSGLLKGRYPLVVMILGLACKETEYQQQIKSPLYSFFSTLAEKYIITHSKNIIVATESIKKIVRQWTAAKIYVVSSGINLKTFQKSNSTSVSEKSDVFIVSRLEKLKGIDLVINATSLLVKEFPTLKVLIAGTGPDEGDLKSLVTQLKLENHIRFLGFVPNDKLYPYYDACHVVVIPSRWDCQPITVFEAAAAGKPVIVSDASNHEIVVEGETGFIFQSENIEELVRKMRILLKNPSAGDRMGKTAQENIKKYDWGEISKHYAGVYREVIDDFYRQNLNRDRP